MSGPFPITLLPQANNLWSTVQARGYLSLMRPGPFNSFDQTVEDGISGSRPTTHTVLFKRWGGISFYETVQQPLQYYSSFGGHLYFLQYFFWEDQVLLLPRWTGLNMVINPYNLALLPTASINKAFLVIVMQFSIDRMIKRRQNTITVYRIDRTVIIFITGGSNCATLI